MWLWFGNTVASFARDARLCHASERLELVCPAFQTMVGWYWRTKRLRLQRARCFVCPTEEMPPSAKIVGISLFYVLFAAESDISVRRCEFRFLLCTRYRPFRPGTGPVDSRTINCEGIRTTLLGWPGLSIRLKAR